MPSGTLLLSVSGPYGLDGLEAACVLRHVERVWSRRATSRLLGLTTTRVTQSIYLNPMVAAAGHDH